MVETKTDAPAPTGGSYVPPALRRQQQTESSDKPAPTAAPAAESAQSTGSKYVPPSMRNRSANDSAIPTTSVNYKRPGKSQPNIMDTMEFPTLDAVEPSVNEKLPTEHSGEKYALYTE